MSNQALIRITRVGPHFGPFVVRFRLNPFLLGDQPDPEGLKSMYARGKLTICRLYLLTSCVMHSSRCRMQGRGRSKRQSPDHWSSRYAL